MQLQHTNPKEFEKRVAIESKKAKDLSSSMEKINKALESEKKAYSGEFAKGLDTYQNNLHLTPQFKMIMKNFQRNLQSLNKTYETSTTHITDVSCNALGYLPKKFETYKKSIKLTDKLPEGINKLKDFEFDRIQYTRESLLHFFNSQMLLHSQALNTFSETFEQLQELEEGQDVAAMYGNSEWIINFLRQKGLKVNRQ